MIKQSSSEEPAAASCPTRHFIATSERQVSCKLDTVRTSHLCNCEDHEVVAHFQSCNGGRSVETGRRLHEDVLRLQEEREEEREEEELKARRKVGVSLCL